MERSSSWPEDLDTKRAEIAKFIDWCTETGHPIPPEVLSDFEFIRATQNYLEAAAVVEGPLVHNPNELLPDAEAAAVEAIEIIDSLPSYRDRQS